ncbi:MAG: DUF4065 domain-containing protein [Gammaproteobacteria bacterium]|nr:DUF4065 domain-containing protein [Gammaproteobacteria bacterium]
MPYSAIAVANHFLDLAKSAGQEITPMKMQKLVYFAHGWHLAIFDAPLIKENVMAWKYGPVISSLYHGFKKYGKSAITDPAVDIVFNKDENGDIDIMSGRFITPRPDNMDSEVEDLLKAVLESYGRLSAIRLSELTHAHDSPWSRVWKGFSSRDVPIPNEEIKKYFSQLKSSAKSSENSVAEASA